MGTKKIVVTGYTDLGEQPNYMTDTKKAILIGEESMDAHDGYHSFSELYDHRITLYITLCRVVRQAIFDSSYKEKEVWRSKVHSDGSTWSEWFILGIGKKKGEQITYHLPVHRWTECDFAETLDKAPAFDGHTSEDVLARLALL